MDNSQKRLKRRPDPPGSINVQDDLRAEESRIREMLDNDRVKVDTKIFNTLLGFAVHTSDRKAEPNTKLFSRCELYDYQKESLAWMLDREKYNPPPPDREREKIRQRRQNQWTTDSNNILTNTSTGVKIKRGWPLVTPSSSQMVPYDREKVPVMLEDDFADYDADEYLELMPMDISLESVDEELQPTDYVDMPMDMSLESMEEESVEDQQQQQEWLAAIPSSKMSSTVLGGILADEMGLGKTIQMTALICTNMNLKTSAKMSGTTLVVVPLILLYQWETELKRCAPELRVYIYHDVNREKSERQLRGFDVVITTYNTLANDKWASEEQPATGLYQVPWWRIILDEAHIIRNANTSLARACFMLTGRFRWALTGTPVHNDYGDLFSLFKFLRLRPYGEFEGWHRMIGKPLSAASSDTYAKYKDNAFNRLRDVVNQVVMRRTKAQERADVRLRVGTVLNFTNDEGNEDTRLWRVTEMELEHFVVRLLDGTATVRVPYDNDSYRLQRQIVYLPPKTGIFSYVDFATQNDRLQYIKLRDEAVTELSRSPIKGPLVHILRMQQFTIHPYLLADKDSVASRLQEIHRTGDCSQFKPGPKIDFLTRDLRETAAADPSVKSIVFSRFTRALDIIETALECAGWMSESDYQRQLKKGRRLPANTPRFVRIDGSKTPEQRREAVDKITNEEGVKLMLLSLLAAGVGLNLVRASNIYFLEPFYSGAVHAQAIDRVHRIGQTRPVMVKNIIMRDTLESNILQLQKFKDEMSNATFRPLNLGVEQIRAMIMSPEQAKTIELKQ